VPPLPHYSVDFAKRTRSGNSYAPIRLNLAINRDLRRAALFRWMMPLPATRSSMLIASPTAVAADEESPVRIAISAFLTNVRAAVRYGRLRRRRRSATRIRFFAESLFAKAAHLIILFRKSSSAGRNEADLLATTEQCYQISSPPASMLATTFHP
jgi:hypothetical protein